MHAFNQVFSDIFIDLRKASPRRFPSAAACCQPKPPYSLGIENQLITALQEANVKRGNSEAVSTLGSLVSPPTLVKEVQLRFSAISQSLWALGQSQKVLGRNLRTCVFNSFPGAATARPRTVVCVAGDAEQGFPSGVSTHI